MQAAIQQAVERALDGLAVPAEQMEQAVGALMDGCCSPVEITALLVALRAKGEAVSELVGAARAMRQRAVRIPIECSGLLDTCGTGGDRLKTFNISTAAALVAAAAGVPVAKHGNRSVSSSSGSADVLEALGVNIQLSPAQVARCVEQIGLGFCFAPLFHQATKHVASVRRELKFRTLFNLLGPLTNPAGAPYQLVGVNNWKNAEKIAHALLQLGTQRSLVVCCEDALDEVGLWGRTLVFWVERGEVRSLEWTAESFGLPECRAEELRVESPEQSAEVIRAVLAGEQGAARDIVVANAAAALIAAGKADSPAQAAQMAAEAIDSRHAAEKLQQLVEFTAG